MSEYLSHGIRDFSKYDTMDTAALNEILRKDCEAPEGEESDAELLLYVMEVLANRREQNNTAGKTTLEAWESFKQNYYPEKELAAAARKTSGRAAAPWLRRVIAAAAVLVLIVSIPVTVRALSWEAVWDIFARWATETFSFVSGEDAHVSEPHKSSAENFTSLQDVLVKSNRDPSILPTWMPEGFVLQEIKKDITPVQEIYYAIYANGEENISIRIHNHIAEDFQKIEINDNLIEVYPKAGEEYYFFSNYCRLQVMWLNGTYECILSGDFTIEEGKQMIDSIRKG